MKWFKIPVQLTEENFIKQFELNAKSICLVKEGDAMYAFQNRCPHAGGHLSQGYFQNGHIFCPIHRWSYDVKTGMGASGQGDCIRTYPLQQKGNELYIGFKSSFWSKFFSRG